MTTERTATCGIATTRTSGRWLAYAASVWAIVFAAVSFYWAVGGTLGVSTLARSIQDLARSHDQAFIVEVWITGVLKLLVAALALALVRPFGQGLPRRLLRLAVWATGVLLVVYGGSNLIQDMLIEFGVVGVPRSMGPEAVRWYLFLWEPWWILGGLLVLGAAWRTRETKRPG